MSGREGELSGRWCLSDTGVKGDEGENEGSLQGGWGGETAYTCSLDCMTPKSCWGGRDRSLSDLMASACARGHLGTLEGGRFARRQP